MKTEDFERLKAVCEKEGFEIDQINSWVIQVQKKDPWDGVEFGILVSQIGNCMEVGKVYKLSLLNDHGRKIWIDNGFLIPSTEAAYIDQLKKEAFERFGEIKEGDRFDRSPIDEKWGHNIVMEKSPFGNFYWKYDKSSDTLFIGRYGIYSKGKWATRVKERVEVEYGHYSLPFAPKYILALHFAIDDPNRMNDDAGKFLAKQLEEYLNKE